MGTTQDLGKLLNKFNGKLMGKSLFTQSGDVKNLFEIIENNVQNG